MFHRSSRFLLASIFCGAALAVTSITAQQKELSSANRKIGNAAVEYRDKAIHVVAAYYHSQRNHDSRWLLVESALSTTENTIIKREHILLRTPQGREIPLATQRRIGEDVKASSACCRTPKSRPTRHVIFQTERSHGRHEAVPVAVRARRPRRVRLGSRSCRDGSALRGADRCVGERTYALVVRHGKGAAELPIVLE